MKAVFFRQKYYRKTRATTVTSCGACCKRQILVFRRENSYCDCMIQYIASLICIAVHLNETELLKHEGFEFIQCLSKVGLFSICNVQVKG